STAGLLIASAATLGAVVVLRGRKDWRLPLAGALAIFGYVSVYALDSQALQPWYIATFAIPSMLLLGPAFGWLMGPARMPSIRAVSFVALVALVLGSLIGMGRPRWISQV